MSKQTVKEADVREHFDSLAHSYDAIKKENSYYYRSLIQAIADVVPPGKIILDIGTGTGEVLNALKPSRGIGIDLSPAMVRRAEEKFPHLSFMAGSFEDIRVDGPFDFVLLADVIEHLESPENVFKSVRKFCSPHTQVLLTMANPGWEPFLHILEKLRLKMDEGPHHRISEKQLFEYGRKEGFLTVSNNSFLLLPLDIPVVSAFFNRRLARLPLINQAALIKRYLFKAAL